MSPLLLVATVLVVLVLVALLIYQRHVINFQREVLEMQKNLITDMLKQRKG